MAPNLKHFSRLTAPLADLKVVRPKDYQPPQPVDSDSYWEWPAPSEPAELVSTDHIFSNLIKDAAKTADCGKSSQNGSSDDYWAEEEVVDQAEPVVSEAVSSKPQHHHEAAPPADYWTETPHERTARDEYWNTAASPDTTELPYPTTTIRNRSVNPSQADVYWQEATHTTDSSLSYWRESRPCESTDGDYWTWNVATPTFSDQYWAWRPTAAVSQ